jgi:hypothetical protein
MLRKNAPICPGCPVFFAKPGQAKPLKTKGMPRMPRMPRGFPRARVYVFKIKKLSRVRVNRRGMRGIRGK